METKKHHKADLEKKKGVFLQIGFVISLAIVLLAFELRFKTDDIYVLSSLVGVEMEVEKIPVTRQKDLKPPEPKMIEKMEIIEDDQILENEIEVTDNEAFQQTKIDLNFFIEDEEEEPPTIFFTDEMPEFPGGKKVLKQYIARNIKYPVQAIEENIQGRIYLRFLVTHEGLIDKATVLRSIHPLLDTEALRIVNSFPKWKPGSQNGRAVNVWYTIPITFQLN
jgi:protein TonB